MELGNVIKTFSLRFFELGDFSLVTLSKLVFDANNDGYLDILLRPFHYGTLYRTNPVWWNVYASKGIKLNHLIWLNNGNGTFSYYSNEDLIIDDILLLIRSSFLSNSLSTIGSCLTNWGAFFLTAGLNLEYTLPIILSVLPLPALS